MEFISLINQFGTVPVLILLVVVFYLLLKDTKKELGGLSQSVSSVKEDVRKQLAAAEQHNEERNRKQDAVIEKLTDRMTVMEQEFVRKVDLQEAIGGWRMELMRLGERIDRILMGGKNNGSSN